MSWMTLCMVVFMSVSFRGVKAGCSPACSAQMSTCCVTSWQLRSKMYIHLLEDGQGDIMIPAPTKAIKLVHSSISAMLHMRTLTTQSWSADLSGV